MKAVHTTYNFVALLQLFSLSLAQTDKGCPGTVPNDGIIFAAQQDAIVEYFPGFPNCPKPAVDDPSYWCRTRDSDNTITFANNVMTVDTNPWVAGGYRMGCMKKDHTTGWQCGAACNVGTKLPTISDWGFVTFDMKVTRVGSCAPRIKFVKSWPALNSASVELTEANNFVSPPDAEGWSQVIIPTHDFKTCQWTDLSGARDIIFENCPSGDHPKYEIRNLILTDSPAPFPNCHCGCEPNSHEEFIGSCTAPPTATPVPTPITVMKFEYDICIDAGQLKEYTIEIPPGIEKLYCKAWGGSGDPTLYVNWGGQIDTTNTQLNTCVADEIGCDSECSGDALKPYQQPKLLHVGVSDSTAYCGVSLTCSYEVLPDVETFEFISFTPSTAEPTSSPTSLPTSSPTPDPCPGLTCNNCFIPNDTCTDCIPDPTKDDTCNPCETVTLSDGSSMSGNDFCQQLGGLSNNYKCCPPSSSCKSTTVTDRTGLAPTSRPVSAICSTSCGDCDAASSGNARACSLFEPPLDLYFDGLAQSDDIFEVCNGVGAGSTDITVSPNTKPI